MPTKAFFIEPIPGLSRRWLRRHASGPCPRMPGQYGYHNGMLLLGDVMVNPGAPGDKTDFPDSDPRWPTHCTCGYAFTSQDPHQVFERHLFRRHDGLPGTWTLDDAPPGAMWNADWLVEVDVFRGPDGMALVAKLPNGYNWHIDGPCSNCTKPDDRVHKCWVRHGDPKTGDVTVDKNGNTCSAGAGSIAVPGYHGFLRNGYFTDG